MKKLAFIAFLHGCLALSNLQAQEPVRTDRSAEIMPHPAPMAAPVAYANGYQQQDFAREYLIRRAQEKSEARRQRIEGMRWLGYSLQRPTVTTTPFSSHAPTWSAVTYGSYFSYPYWSHPVNFSVQGVLP